MAWIESHQELKEHPKTRKLARMLSISVPAVMGHLHCLWYWAMDYAEDGDLSRYDAGDIADAVMWEGDPQELVDALTSAGFLDREGDRLVIHDWDEYAGRLIRRRQQARERARRAREAYAQRTRTVPVTHAATQHNTTQHNSTQPNQDISRSSGTQRGKGQKTQGESKARGASRARPPQPVDEEFIGRMVATYGADLGGEEAVRLEIADALNHRAADKRKDLRLYVQNWLRREVAYRRNGTGPARPPPRAPAGRINTDRKL